MDNALPLVAQTKVGETEFLDVVLECQTLCSGVVFLYEGPDVLEVFSRCGRYVLFFQSVHCRPSCGLCEDNYVVSGCKGAVRSPDLPLRIAQALERLG